MKFPNLSLLATIQLVLLLLAFEAPRTSVVLAQEPSFELPVQLVGFPVIILSVRLANFVRKLSYALDPSTYRRRTRRGADVDGLLEAIEAEKSLVAEFGEEVCVYERICSHYASKAQRTRSKEINWETVLGQYKKSPDKHKEYYLLSVFLGDIVASPNLCHQLAKRRQCSPGMGWEQKRR